MPTIQTDPVPNCTLCPRLLRFRRANQKAYPGFFNGAVPNFGDRDAAVLIVGLAPGLKGANQTGRAFTGDFAGDLLFKCLAQMGWTSGKFGNQADDGLTLKGVMITNAVRCVPPQNKPTGEEVNTCRPFLDNTMASMPNLKVLFALGKVAHDTILRMLTHKVASYKFAHGAVHLLPSGLVLVDSYHCSRYNVNTKRLDEAMFMDALKLAEHASRKPAPAE